MITGLLILILSLPLSLVVTFSALGTSKKLYHDLHYYSTLSYILSATDDDTIYWLRNVKQ